MALPTNKIACDFFCIVTAGNTKNRDTIRSAGGIGPLVLLASEGSAKAKAEATSALGGLAICNLDNQEAIREAGGVTALVAIAREGSDELKALAARAMGNIAAHNIEYV